MLVSCPEVILGTAVTSPAGTFTSPYPTGYVQADFTSANASATAIMIVNGNDRWEEVDDEFDISYDASEITVTQKTGATLAIGTRIVVGAARIDSDAVVSQSAAIVALTDNTGDSGTHDDTLADGSTVGGAITDNTTGSAAATWAAGVGVMDISIPHTFIGGTSAVEPLTNWTPGFKFKVLSWDFVTEVALVGASGSRVANLEIGTTDVGTVVSTCTVPIANAAVGTVTAATAVAGANTGTAADTLSLEIASGGTAFSAGSGTFHVRIQNMDTADAMAKVAAQLNLLRTDNITQNQNVSDLGQKCNNIIVGLRASDVIDT